MMSSLFSVLLISYLASTAVLCTGTSVMVCDDAKQVELLNTIATSSICDFEVKFKFVPNGESSGDGNSGRFNHTIKYPGGFSVSVLCPQAIMQDPNGDPIDFIHVREVECADASMTYDLYVPGVHLRGTGIKLNTSINGEELVVTF